MECDLKDRQCLVNDTQRGVIILPFDCSVLFMGRTRTITFTVSVALDPLGPFDVILKKI